MAFVPNLLAVPLKHPLRAPKRHQAAVIRLKPLPRQQLRAVVIPPEELCRALEQGPLGVAELRGVFPKVCRDSVREATED